MQKASDYGHNKIKEGQIWKCQEYGGLWVIIDVLSQLIWIEQADAPKKIEDYVFTTQKFGIPRTEFRKRFILIKDTERKQK